MWNEKSLVGFGKYRLPKQTKTDVDTKKAEKQQQTINCKTWPNRESNTFHPFLCDGVVWHQQWEKERNERRRK